MFAYSRVYSVFISFYFVALMIRGKVHTIAHSTEFDVAICCASEFMLCCQMDMSSLHHSHSHSHTIVKFNANSKLCIFPAFHVFDGKSFNRFDI